MNIGLYIHIPYCSQICPYCDFAKTANLASREAFLAALKQEIALKADAQFRVQTLYFGGGTPSVLSAEQLQSIVEALKSAFDLQNLQEFTLEVDPADVSLEDARAWKDLGVSRLSLGVQSFDDQHLKLLGRGHSGQQARQSYECLRSLNHFAINMDLICGYPGQSLKDSQKNLEAMIGLEPDHISVYALHLEPGSVWYKKKQSGRLNLDELSFDEQGQILLDVVQRLRSSGYDHYELSNYAKQEAQRSQHNLIYWKLKPYLGLGPSAHSFVSGRRWYNEPSVGQYIRLMREGCNPQVFYEQLSEEQMRIEDIWLSLRLFEGIPAHKLEDKRLLLEKLKQQGLLEGDQQIVVTAKGVAVFDELIVQLI